jgi:hypothetical protein
VCLIFADVTLTEAEEKLSQHLSRRIKTSKRKRAR